MNEWVISILIALVVFAIFAFIFWMIGNHPEVLEVGIAIIMGIVMFIVITVLAKVLIFGPP